MIKCPNCGGYGQTTSTRNGNNEVIRYHKCRECEHNFTSIQKLENNYINISRNNIDSILKSDEFKFVINKLFSAFELDGLNNSINISDNIYDNDEVELVSNIFTDNYKFVIRLKTYQNKADGTIKLYQANNNLVALIGFISYNKEWCIYLDILTINKILEHNIYQK